MGFRRSEVQILSPRLTLPEMGGSVRASHWCLGPPPLTTFSQTRLSGAEDILCPRGERADPLFHPSYPPLMAVLQASATVEGMSDCPAQGRAPWRGQRDDATTRGGHDHAQSPGD